MVISPQIEASWLNTLSDQFNQEYFKSLKTFLQKEKQDNTVIYPEGKNIFNAFNLTPFKNIKVVIIGQDPYHGPNQAHGLCFSVQKGVRVPPSLQNIYKELHNDLGFVIPEHGDLSSWAKQGVLLLNTVLTVRKGLPNSHRNCGWENFTDAVIKKISNELSNVVFVLWGAFAAGKAELIDDKKHLVLKAPHPSPFSAHKGFFGCKHFSRINSFLEKNKKESIDWQL